MDKFHFYVVVVEYDRIKDVLDLNSNEKTLGTYKKWI